MIDKTFPGVTYYATERKGATEARYSGKKACTDTRDGTVNFVTSGSRRIRKSSLRRRIQVGHFIRALPRESDE